jgi:hypothetical protein
LFQKIPLNSDKRYFPEKQSVLSFGDGQGKYLIKPMRREVKLDLSKNHLGADYYMNFKAYQELMSSKVREILLVSSSYDAFIIEEDGSLASRIINEYRGLKGKSRYRYHHAAPG